MNGGNCTCVYMYIIIREEMTYLKNAIVSLVIPGDRY